MKLKIKKKIKNLCHVIFWETAEPLHNYCGPGLYWWTLCFPFPSAGWLKTTCRPDDETMQPFGFIPGSREDVADNTQLKSASSNIEPVQRKRSCILFPYSNITWNDMFFCSHFVQIKKQSFKSQSSFFWPLPSRPICGFDIDGWQVRKQTWSRKPGFSLPPNRITLFFSSILTSKTSAVILSHQCCWEYHTKAVLLPQCSPHITLILSSQR